MCFVLLLQLVTSGDIRLDVSRMKWMCGYIEGQDEKCRLEGRHVAGVLLFYYIVRHIS